jgi:cullin-4
MLMDANRVADLQRMYALFARVNALESLKQALSAYIKATGNSTVMDEEKDKDMVSWLLDLKARLDAIWEESFSKNETFANTLKDAFEHLINLRQVYIICSGTLTLSCLWSTCSVVATFLR